MWVFEIIWKYRGIFVLLIIGAWLFYNYALPQPQQEVVQQVQEELKWSCKVWEEPVTIKEHSFVLERCWKEEQERYRLYYGSVVFIEELYVYGLYHRGTMNKVLLTKLFGKNKNEAT
jgi:hypothetical protein